MIQEDLLREFKGPTTQQYVRAKSMQTWTLKHCILKHITKDQVEIEVFDDSVTHEWMLRLNECAKQAIDTIMPASYVSFKLPYNIKSNSFKFRISNEAKDKLRDRWPTKYEDVDVVFCINCAWASYDMKGISFGLLEIRPSTSSTCESEI